jgi:hypothetical protein
VYRDIRTEIIAKEVKKDGAREELCRQIEAWLPYAGYTPPALGTRAMFRVKIAGGGSAGLMYLLRLSLSPTDGSSSPCQALFSC